MTIQPKRDGQASRSATTLHDSLSVVCIGVCSESCSAASSDAIGGQSSQEVTSCTLLKMGSPLQVGVAVVESSF